MAAAALAIPAILSGAGTILSGFMSSQAANAQARAGQQVANEQAKHNEVAARHQAEWSKRRALEEQAAGQRQATSRLREMEQAQSRMVAVAAADGSGITDDDSVLDLYGDVAEEGNYNAQMETAGAEQRASTLRHDARLGVWQATNQGMIDRHKADAQARIDKASGRATLIGSILKGASSIAGGVIKTPMAQRYGSRSSQSGSLRYG